MYLRLVFVFVFAGLLGTAARADDAALAAEMAKLEGTWEPIENILNGVPTPMEILKQFRTVVKNDAYQNQHKGMPDTRGPLKFVAKRDKVLHLDLYPTVGPGKGKVVKCILEWVGDDGFRICMPGEPDGDRPSEFTSKEGSGHILRTYKRVKE